MFTPDSNHTSPARRTISLLRSLCVEAGLLPDKFLRRLATGRFRREPETQVAPTPDDFDDDWTARIQETVVCAGVAVARGLVTRDDPLLRVYMLACKRMVDTQAAMIERHQRDTGPDWDCYAPPVQWDADDHDA